MEVNCGVGFREIWRPGFVLQHHRGALIISISASKFGPASMLRVEPPFAELRHAPPWAGHAPSVDPTGAAAPRSSVPVPDLPSWDAWRVVAAAPAELAVGSTTSDGLVIKDFGNGQAVSCQLGKFRAVPREISPEAQQSFGLPQAALIPNKMGCTLMPWMSQPSSPGTST